MYKLCYMCAVFESRNLTRVNKYTTHVHNFLKIPWNWCSSWRNLLQIGQIPCCFQPVGLLQVFCKRLHPQKWKNLEFLNVSRTLWLLQKVKLWHVYTQLFYMCITCVLYLKIERQKLTCIYVLYVCCVVLSSTLLSTLVYLESPWLEQECRCLYQ